MTHRPELFAQGDILLQPVIHTRSPQARAIARDQDGGVVLGRGELSGHRHLIMSENVQFFSEDAIANLDPNYVGHLTVSEDVELCHDEHAPITLPAGSTYLVRRQRVFDPARSTRRSLLAGD